MWPILWWDFVTEYDSLHSLMFCLDRESRVDCKIELAQN